MRRAAWLLIGVVIGSAALASAQARSNGWGRTDLPYDGQLTFVRLRWQGGTYGTPIAGGGVNFWLHEYPQSEQNLTTAIGDFTLIDTRTDGSLVLTLDDPELFKHPIAVMWEPGFWIMTDVEAAQLRAYLRKGGFVIFNDFEGQQWENFEAQMRRVVPDGRWIRIDEAHPIFDTFFRIDEIDVPNPAPHHLAGLIPEHFGLFEDNDPNGRMMAIAAYNTNLGEYWQMAGSRYIPVGAFDIGFRVGINYIVYALTH